MKKLICTLLALVMLLSMSVYAFAEEAADESLKKIQDKGELVMGLDSSFPPMGFTDEDGNIVGFDIDLAEGVAERLGVTLKLQPIDWSAKELELSSGAIDCIWNGMTITPDREEQMQISIPYIANAQVLCVKNDSEVQTLADMSGKTLALQAGSSAVDALNKAEDFKASLASVAEFDENMTALLDLDAGNVDAVLIDKIVAEYYIKTKEAGYRLLEEELAIEEYGIGFRKGDVALCDAVNQVLVDMYNDGSMSVILNEWFGNDDTIVAEAEGAKAADADSEASAEDETVEEVEDDAETEENAAAEEDAATEEGEAAAE